MAKVGGSLSSTLTGGIGRPCPTRPGSGSSDSSGVPNGVDGGGAVLANDDGGSDPVCEPSTDGRMRTADRTVTGGARPPSSTSPAGAAGGTAGELIVAETSLPKLEELRSQTAAGLKSLGHLQREVEAAKSDLERTQSDVDEAIRELKSLNTRNENGDASPSPGENDRTRSHIPANFPAEDEEQRQRAILPPWSTSEKRAPAGSGSSLSPASPSFRPKGASAAAGCKSPLSVAAQPFRPYEPAGGHQSPSISDPARPFQPDEFAEMVTIGQLPSFSAAAPAFQLNKPAGPVAERQSPSFSSTARPFQPNTHLASEAGKQLASFSAAAPSFQPNKFAESAAGRQSPTFSATARPFQPNMPAVASSKGPQSTSFSAAAPAFQPNKFAESAAGRQSPSFSANARPFQPNMPAVASAKEPQSASFSTSAAAFQPDKYAESVARRQSLSFSASARPFQPNAASAAAQPFQPSNVSAAAQPFQPKTASTAAGAGHLSGAAMNRKTKAVVVEISAPKRAAAALRPAAALPGMEYLVGVDGARTEAEKRTRLERRRRSKEEEERAAAAAEAEQEKQAAAQDRDEADVAEPKEPAAASVVEPPHGPKKSSHGPKEGSPVAVAVSEVDEMPELDDIMALLDNRSISNEERRKKIDKMFG